MDDLSDNEAIEGQLEAGEVGNHHPVPPHLVVHLLVALGGHNPLTEDEQTGEDATDKDGIGGDTSIVDLFAQLGQHYDRDCDVTEEHRGDNDDGLVLE